MGKAVIGVGRGQGSGGVTPLPGRLGRVACGAGLALLAMQVQPAGAETFAVLVGAADYRVLDADLKGPANDVRLMARVLAGRGVATDDMVVLTDAPQGLPDGVATGIPDLAGIRAALAGVAARAGAGDTVVFHFSGHGTQTPDQNGDEGGGSDEVLLPVDAEGWDGAGLRNALVDDELGDWARGLLERGVQVVGLIDACHSDTGFRAMTGGMARGLAPESLGVPDAALGGDPLPGEGLGGAFVFLYSSQSDQRSFEFPFGGEWHGAFTAALAGVLEEADEATWAQVLAAASDRMARGEAAQVPDGEGPLLQARVFGTGEGRARWRLDGDRVQAGLLQGLEEGTVVAFHAGAAGGEALGEARVVRVKAAEAALDRAAPAGAAWVEWLADPPPAPLALAAPVRADAADGFDYAPWLAVLPAPAARPDLVPVLVGGGLALAGPDGALDPDGPGSTPRVLPEDGESAAAALDRVLAQAGHALRLKAALLGNAGRSLTGGRALVVEFERRSGTETAEGCAVTGAGAPADPARGVLPCDALWLRVTNRSGSAQDVSALYFGADFSVTPIWPPMGLSNRLAPGEAARIGLQISAGSVPAMEELLIVAVPADGDRARTDLSLLAAPEMTRARAGGDAPLAAWLDARLSGDEGMMRGFATRPPAYVIFRQPVRIRAAETGN